jgi:Na+/H+ antiporter NhaD/arsenite permease-like protein
MPDLTQIAAVMIFLATYAFVAVGKLPGYRIDRAGAALLGASLMVGTGVLTADAFLNQRYDLSGDVNSYSLLTSALPAF